MTRLRSFSALTILGSVLWTLGLLSIAHMLVLVTMRHVPALLYANHHTVLVLGVILMLAGVAVLRNGLSSFWQLKQRLASVRTGDTPRVEGTYPNEIQPLVDDLNALLDDRERAIARALTTAGDLAHGLKTPLALLSQEADRAASSQHQELASAIHQQIEKMRRQIDYHLAQARAGASKRDTTAHCAVSGCVEGLVRTLTKLYADRGLLIQVNVATSHTLRARCEDVEEMVGNLLDNAYKWASTTISIRSFEEDTSVVITVEDDGPGLVPENREKVLQRGVRADEAAPGSGFGLAIVGEVANLYEGTITLHNSELGGLQARLELPKR